jgi:RNA polymerase sigma-32 factor
MTDILLLALRRLKNSFFRFVAARDEFEYRRKALASALSVLNDRERRIFEARRLAEDPTTLVDLASEFGVSRERVRQINVSSFEKVQKAMKKRVAAMGTPAPIQVR